jgi:hypothetical protein
VSHPDLSARQRAYALASTGDYLLWPPIANVLVNEGYSAAVIKQLGKERAAQREIAARIHAAIASQPSPPTETWRIRAPETKAKLK